MVHLEPAPWLNGQDENVLCHISATCPAITKMRCNFLLTNYCGIAGVLSTSLGPRQSEVRAGVTERWKCLDETDRQNRGTEL